jgi:hypothetical protein
MAAGAGLNRALWAFRALFALLALGLLAMILRPQAFESSPPTSSNVAVVGQTVQGIPVVIRFDRPGHPVSFKTRITGRCSGGNTWNWGWWPHDSGGSRFARDGDVLRVVTVDDRVFDDGAWGQVVLSMRAKVEPHGRAARGWVRMSGAFFYPEGRVTCESGIVPFATGSTSGRPS